MELQTVLAYLKNMPHANSGAGGHNATLNAALACKRFGLAGAEMWEAMQWWNDNCCTPRWSEKELRHKIDSVAEVTIKKPLGRQRNFKHAAPRVFVAPALAEKKEDARPIAQRSPQEEELWWEQVAAERGVTLADWDNVGEEDVLQA